MTNYKHQYAGNLINTFDRLKYMGDIHSITESQ